MAAGFSSALLALDLSSVSDRLVEWALYLLRVGTTRLVLLHVIPVSKLEHVAGYPADKLREELEAEALKKLEQYARTLRDAGFEVEVVKPPVGDPAPTIAREAEERGVDYIVVGDRGRGFFRRLLLGSTVDELIDYSTKPILVVKGIVVRGETVVPRDPFRGPVLVALDLGPETPTLVEYAYTLSVKADVDLVLLHVVEPGEDLEGVTGQLERLRKDLVSRGAKVADAIAVSGEPGKGIVSEAERLDASLILIGHGHGEGLLRGSVTDTVVRRSRRHVLVIPWQGKD